MTETIKFRRGTAAEWAVVASTVVPAQGEPCFETDTNQLKIGDGLTTYSDLAYINAAQTAGGTGPPGQPRFVGQGPPDIVLGSSPGDAYLDESTGIIYTLL